MHSLEHFFTHFMPSSSSGRMLTSHTRREQRLGACHLDLGRYFLEVQGATGFVNAVDLRVGADVGVSIQQGAPRSKPIYAMILLPQTPEKGLRFLETPI